MRVILRKLRLIGVAAAFAAVLAGTAVSISAAFGDDAPVVKQGLKPLPLNESEEQLLLQRDLAFISRRTAGNTTLGDEQAGSYRSDAESQAGNLRNGKGTTRPPIDPVTFTGAWTGLGPNPIVQISRSGDAGGTPYGVSGRIGALAIRPSNGQFILGAAQGGIWLYDAATGTWSPKTDNLPSLAIGALALAPSNDAIVYAGTGEGSLAGDSYFGNGVLKSTDGGSTWTHVSQDYFAGVAISRIVVDPTNAQHVYAAVLRGRGGARRTSPTDHSRFGIWESADGGVSWKLDKLAKSESNGATDLELDPRNPKILYASFWSDAIYKSTDGGRKWTTAMAGLPVADYAAGQTRFSIAISHPVGKPAVLYAGFDYVDATGAHPSRIWKSTNEAASWTVTGDGTGDESVVDYCGTQCYYDNVVEADPTNPDVVFAGGMFGYDIGSGGIFRSDDGGGSWKNLGWDQHPDFHALAFDPAHPAHVLVGSDGGVWSSDDRGGRPTGAEPLSAVTWQDLNGSVAPNTAVTHRTGLAISQFTSIATVPTVPARFWGGTQDNGTIRKSAVSQTWSDVASGDGGQALVDPTNANYVYGTFFGISPYRYTNGGGVFFSNQYIREGIDLTDRSDFYIPFVLNKANPKQLFLGTYRVYRTDNAKVPSAGDVRWKPISPDLTSGCTGTAPNGARNCTVSAIGVGGGNAVYSGSLDGYVYLSTDAQVSASPTWTRIGYSGGDHQGQGNDGASLPARPVTQIAVDRSNYRIAYVAFAGFDAATPNRPGHVFATRDGGQSFTDITANLPDAPVNSIVLDPSFPNTLYLGTDVGPFVTYNGGQSWLPLGTGMPVVADWQLDLDPSHRTLAVGTHGRGAFSLTDPALVPALVLSASDGSVPIGPGSTFTYTFKLDNVGNAAATGVTLTDPVPANTSFVSADSGGTVSGNTVTWSGLTVPAGGSTTVQLTVQVSPSLSSSVTAITNDGSKATSAQGPSTTGSPTVTPIAPAYAVKAAPATQTDGAKTGQSVSYTVTLTNQGYRTDKYAMSSSGGTFPASFYDSTCTTSITTTPSVTAGGTTDVCFKVTVPAAAANGATSTATVTATSVGSSTVSASVTVKTIAVGVATLLVDGDGNAPDVQATYAAALGAAGVAFSTWDLAADSELPLNYLKSFKNVVWFTGNSYPGPIVPYEASLKSFLDAGGRLFLNGQDLLDQAAGTTAFVHDYLHVAWDGSEAQNDKATTSVKGVAGSPVTATIGTVPLNTSVLGNTFMDRITPTAGALGAFTDDSGATDALTVSTPAYKVVFLSFPFEEYGSAAQKAELITKVMGFFGP